MNTPFDFKKEYKEFYLPKNKPVIVDVPPMNFIAVRGEGDPNSTTGEFQKAIEALYPVAFTIKMSHRTDHRIKGYFEYVVPPLEGLWWQDGDRFDCRDKDAMKWICMIRLPDFVTETDLDWAKESVLEKKEKDCSKVEFMSIEDGLCVQCMHIGPFDDEWKTIDMMEKFCADNGYEIDISGERRHREIYLSDFRRTDPSELKTVIREPVRPI